MESATSSRVPAQRITKETKALLRLSRSSSIPVVDLQLIDVPDPVLSCIPPMLALELLVLPVYLKTDRNGCHTLYVAAGHPSCEDALRRLADVTGVMVRPLLADSSAILAAIVDYYGVSVPCSADDACSADDDKTLRLTDTASTEVSATGDRRESTASAA